MYRAKHDEYRLGHLNQHCSSSQLLWRSLSSALGRDRDVTGVTVTGHTAEGFTTCFAQKVEDVMADTAGIPPPSIHSFIHLYQTTRSIEQEEPQIIK